VCEAVNIARGLTDSVATCFTIVLLERRTADD